MQIHWLVVLASKVAIRRAVRESTEFEKLSWDAFLVLNHAQPFRCSVIDATKDMFDRT